MTIENMEARLAARRARIPVGAPFHEAWYPGETPHLIKGSRIRKDVEMRREGYNLWGSQKDRSLKQHQQKLGFELSDFAHGEPVLVIGSGVARQFERELHEVRPDITTFSLDPLLRYGIRERIRVAIEMGSKSTLPGIDRYGYEVDFPDEIMSDDPFYRPGAVAGAIEDNGKRRQGIPFKGGSFDHVLALHSLPQYSRKGDVPYMLGEVTRVLRPGETARFYPFFLEDLPALNDNDVRKTISEPEITNIGRFHAGGFVGDWAPDHRRVVFKRAPEVST